MGEYSRIRKISRGTFSDVYLAEHRKTRAPVALKAIRLEPFAKASLGMVMREVTALSQLRAPNVVRYITSYVVGKNVWIVMELVQGGSLKALLNKCGNIPESSCALVLRDTLAGLAYVHASGYIHMDVKPGNILITPDGVCKLCDLGVSKKLSHLSDGLELLTPPPPECADNSDEDSSSSRGSSGGGGGGFSLLGMLGSIASLTGMGTPPTPASPRKRLPHDPTCLAKRFHMDGTQNYMSPEMLTHGPTSYNTDVWSLGITALHLAQITPHARHKPGAPSKDIKLTTYGPPPRLDATFSATFQDFVSKCLTTDAYLRPSADALLTHRFVRAPPACARLLELVRKAMRKRSEDSEDEVSSDESSRASAFDGWAS